MDLSDKSVLLVDDNKAAQNLCGIYLNKMGVENLDIVENGIEAIEMVRKKLYDLILMDIQMPTMGGEEAAYKIRKMEKGNYPKIIAYTALDSFVPDENFDGNILKPVSIRKFSKVIFDVLSK